MTRFDLLRETAVPDTDLVRKNDEVGDNFTIAREVDLPSRLLTKSGQTTSPDLANKERLIVPATLEIRKAAPQDGSCKLNPSTGSGLVFRSGRRPEYTERPRGTRQLP